MVMGPQILTAIFLVTSKEPVKNSIAMLLGVAVAASISILIWFGLYDALGIDPPRARVRAGLITWSPLFWPWPPFTRSWGATQQRSRSG